MLAYLARTLMVVCTLCVSSCIEASTASPETMLVGSTPGGAVIKSMLGIEATKPVDFIRWHLVLKERGRSFVMGVSYGVGKPNTRDFEAGGEKRTFEGNYNVTKDGVREIYTFTSDKMTQPVSLIKLNDDLFHVLTPDKQLMVGNGGWSYSLTRKNASSTRSPSLTSFEPSNATPPQAVFDGRTPCLEIAKEYRWQIGDECLKLKWRLTLFRDAKTGKPTTYNLQRTLHRSEPIVGAWTVVTGTRTDPKAVVYRLDPDSPDRSMSFLVGDENVLFFLDKDGRLYTGNEDFSYTLNRRND